MNINELDKVLCEVAQNNNNPGCWVRGHSQCGVNNSADKISRAAVNQILHGPAQLFPK